MTPNVRKILESIKKIKASLQTLTALPRIVISTIDQIDEGKLFQKETIGTLPGLETKLFSALNSMTSLVNDIESEDAITANIRERLDTTLSNLSEDGFRASALQSILSSKSQDTERLLITTLKTLYKKRDELLEDSREETLSPNEHKFLEHFSDFYNGTLKITAAEKDKKGKSIKDLLKDDDFVLEVADEQLSLLKDIAKGYMTTIRKIGEIAENIQYKLENLPIEEKRKSTTPIPSTGEDSPSVKKLRDIFETASTTEKPLAPRSKKSGFIHSSSKRKQIKDGEKGKKPSSPTPPGRVKLS